MTSLGSRSGVNWMRRKRAGEAAGQRAGQHRLAGARDVLDEQVALAEQGHQGQPHLAVLADDDALDIGGDALA